MSSTTTLLVKPCPPTCAITVSPLPVKAGQPFTVDLTGSRVAAGSRGGIKSARVELVDTAGAVVETFDLSAPALRRSDVTIRKGGTLRASVTDEAGQVSTNSCEVQAGVQAAAACRSSLVSTAARNASSRRSPTTPAGAAPL